MLIISLERRIVNIPNKTYTINVPEKEKEFLGRENLTRQQAATLSLRKERVGTEFRGEVSSVFTPLDACGGRQPFYRSQA